MNWLYISFTQLQLDHIEQVKKDRRPLVIIDAKINEVTQLSECAAHHGIKKHMGLATTMALADELSIEMYCEELELTLLNQISEELYLVISDIYQDPPCGIYVNMAPLLSYHGSEAELWAKASEVLRSFHVKYLYANAHSPSSAKLLAKAGANKLFQSKHSVLANIKSMPVRCLAVTAKQHLRLSKVGINTIGHLLDTPLKELAIRFDLEVINAIGNLKGELKAKLQAFRPKKSFYKRLELNYEVTEVSRLMVPIKKLLSELQEFLVTSELTTTELQVSLTDNVGVDQSITINSVNDMQYREQWLTLVNLKFEKLNLSAPIRTIQLTVRNLQLKVSETDDLFTKQQKSGDTLQLIDLLTTKLGKDAVRKIEYHQQHLPEQSTKEHNSFFDRKNSAQLSLVSKISDRPAILLVSPKQLTGKFELLSHAERIESNWWYGETIIRDYFIGKNSNNQLLWLFKDPDKRWYLHGYFS